MSGAGRDCTSKPIANQNARFVVPEDNREPRVIHIGQHQIGYLPVDHTLYRIASDRACHVMASLVELGFPPLGTRPVSLDVDFGNRCHSVGIKPVSSVRGKAT